MVTSNRFTATEKHREAIRELKFRQKVYERLVANGGMKRETADRQIALMEEIAEDYAELMKQERLL